MNNKLINNKEIIVLSIMFFFPVRHKTYVPIDNTCSTTELELP